MANEALRADWIVNWIRERAEDPDLQIDPASKIKDLPLDSLAWLDLLFELEQMTGVPPTEGADGDAVISEVVRPYGIVWDGRG